jgi:hypothetical protein
MYGSNFFADGGNLTPRFGQVIQSAVNTLLSELSSATPDAAVNIIMLLLSALFAQIYSTRLSAQFLKRNAKAYSTP